MQTPLTRHVLPHAVSVMSKPTAGELSGLWLTPRLLRHAPLTSLEVRRSHNVPLTLLQAAMLLGNPSMAPPPRHVTPLLSRMSTCSSSSYDTEVRQ